MNGADEMDRNALAVLIDRTLRAEARTDAPPEAERGNWLYGGVEPLTFTEPDRYGWMAIEPSTSPKVWIPRALCFWREAVTTGAPVSPELAAHPAHSLARWPAIEAAIGRLAEAEATRAWPEPSP